MAQMRIASATYHLGALHAERDVDHIAHIGPVNRLEIAGPAGAAVKLGLGVE